MSRIKRMKEKGLISPPSWLSDNMCYEVMMGSTAYGVSDESSDIDVYGFCIPPKHIIFPHTAGVIFGFDRNFDRFEQFQQHHVIDKETSQEYDFSIYNIVKYFSLVMENNPNMIDSLFVPLRCVLHSTAVGNHVRRHRKSFLHAGSYWKFKGYAYSQMHKIEIKKPKEGSKRADLVEKFGYDTKFAMHLVRLMSEAEQILIEGDLDITRNREQLKAIRRGEWTIEQIKRHFEDKERALENLYNNTALPHRPDEAKIKKILTECLELHYGSLGNAEIEQPDLYKDLLRKIHNLSDV